MKPHAFLIRSSLEFCDKRRQVQKAVLLVVHDPGNTPYDAHQLLISNRERMQPHVHAQLTRCSQSCELILVSRGCSLIW